MTSPRQTSATQTDPHPYAALTPDLLLNAIESIGMRCDGRLLALNSYENRVYQVGMEEGPPVVAKFYRPGCWTERDPAQCHRSLIADWLTLQGVQIVHLLAPGESRPHLLSPRARRESAELVYDREHS